MRAPTTSSCSVPELRLEHCIRQRGARRTAYGGQERCSIPCMPPSYISLREPTWAANLPKNVRSIFNGSLRVLRSGAAPATWERG